MSFSLYDFYEVLPDEVNGWKKSRQPGRYTKDTLFDYINGGAELYIAYNFIEALSIEYEKNEDFEIIVDIFDMTSSFDAYGIFSYGREEEDARIGQGSEYNSGLLTFWKDRFYVSILAYPETEDKKKIVLELGNILADSISSKGDLPSILKLLPERNLIPGSVCYLHNHIVLNNLFYISNENILFINNDVPTVLARYKENEQSFYLLILNYPDKRYAEKAHESFLTHYLPDAVDGKAETNPGKWTGCKLKNNLLVVIFDAPSKELLEEYLFYVKDGKF
ncbi:MAG TPA: hypothetical protein ENN58_04355 [bacterium]|nr:hypothetical protein [bacterium]